MTDQEFQKLIDAAAYEMLSDSVAHNESDFVDVFSFGANFVLKNLDKVPAVEELIDCLHAVRSQMCWELDRDQLSMGMKDLHASVTKTIEEFEKSLK